MTKTAVLEVKAPELPSDTGLTRKDREKLAEHLNEALASTYVLYAKTQTFHWNVAGPLFYSVHNLTEKQYEDLAQAIDSIAERVRAIGFPADGGLKRLSEASHVEDCSEVAPSARSMLSDLARDHQVVAGQLREAVAVAEEVRDVYTADLLTSRIGVHEEASWMLGSMLAE